jgi:hypothetical protein
MAVSGQATLREAFTLLVSPEVNGSAQWHLVVAKTDKSWAVRRFADLFMQARMADESQLDTPLDQLDWLLPAQVVDLAEMGPSEAEREARGAPGHVVIVIEGDDLAGILYTGTQRSKSVSTSELGQLPGEKIDLERFKKILIPKRKPRRSSG